MHYVLKFHDVPDDIHLNTIVVREAHGILNEDFSSLTVPEMKVLEDANVQLSKLRIDSDEDKAKLADIFNYVCTHEAVSVLGMLRFTRLTVDNNLMITYKDYPNFQQFVKKVGLLLRAAATFKEEP